MIKDFRNILKLLTVIERRRFVWLMILNIFISIADIAALALLVLVVNFYIHPGNSSILSFLPKQILDVHSIALIAIFFLLFGLKNLAAYLVNRAQQGFVYGVAARISKKNLLQYLNGDFAAYSLQDSAVHIRWISHEPLEYCQYVLSGVQQIIMQAFLVILAALAIVLYSPKLFLLLFIILLPPIVFIAFLLKKKLRSLRQEIKTSNEKMLQHLKEALAGYVESNVYDKSEFFSNRYTKFQHLLNKRLTGLQIMQSLPNRLIEVFAVLGLFILIIISKWFGENTIDIITIGAFMAAAYKIIPGIVNMMNAVGQVKVYGYTVNDQLEKDENIRVKENINEKIFWFEFKNVHFTFKEKPIVNDLSFSIKCGDFLGISGLSGRGKTTVINLLLGFLEVQEGKIFINNKDSNSERRRDFQKNISYAKQQPFLIHDTILNNIVLGDDNYDKDHLAKAIEASGLQETMSLFPEGLQKIITENGKNISGGQRQRIAIARAIYKDANFIILDESFSELDEQSEEYFLKYFKKLSEEGQLVILITHNKKGLLFCNKTLSLDEQA